MTGWAPIPGWEGHYEAHPDGLIRSLDRVLPVGHWQQRKPGRTLRPGRTNGYQAVTFGDGQRKERRYVHHVIAEVFIGPRPNGLVVCHNNGDSEDNAAANLRYDTQRENVLDSIRHGRHREASRDKCAKGHPYTPENTAHWAGRKARYCRECNNARGRAWYAKKAGYWTLRSAS